MIDEPRLFPATYQSPVAKQVRPLLTVLGLALLALFGRAQLTLTSPLWIWVFSFVLLGLLIFGALNAGMCRVTLYVDRIEKRTWLGKQTWRREDVARIWPRPTGGFWLAHRQNSGYYFTVPAGIERDAAWDAWLAHVPTSDRLTRRAGVHLFLDVVLVFSIVGFFICLLLFFVVWGGEVRQRAAADYVHTQAKVERTWKVRGKGGYTQYAEISFQREQDGKTIPCTAEIGGGALKPDDLIEIALEPHSCYSPIVLGSTVPYPMRKLVFGIGMLAFLAIGIILIWRPGFRRKKIA